MNKPFIIGLIAGLMVSIGISVFVLSMIGIAGELYSSELVKLVSFAMLVTGLAMYIFSKKKYEQQNTENGKQ